MAWLNLFQDADVDLGSELTCTATDEAPVFGIKSTIKLMDATTRAMDASTRSMQASGPYFQAIERQNQDFRARLGRHGGPIMLAASALIPSALGLALMGLSTQSTRTRSTGNLWWKETTTATVPAAERVAMMLIGLLLLMVAVAMGFFAWRIFKRQRSMTVLRGILTTVDSIELERVASLMGTDLAIVARQIHELIGSGEVSGLSVDYQRMLVVRNGTGS